MKTNLLCFSLALSASLFNAQPYYQQVSQTSNRKVYAPVGQTMKAGFFTTGWSKIEDFGKYNLRFAKYKLHNKIKKNDEDIKDRGNVVYDVPNHGNITLGPIPMTDGFVKKGLIQHNIHNAVRLLLDGTENHGVEKLYDDNSVNVLRLNIPDHKEPSVNYLLASTHFLQDRVWRGKNVYVHCKAGHGRSAAVVYAFLIVEMKRAQPKRAWDDILIEAQKRLNSKREVRYFLYRQADIIAFIQFLDPTYTPDFSKHQDIMDEKMMNEDNQYKNDEKILKKKAEKILHASKVSKMNQAIQYNYRQGNHAYLLTRSTAPSWWV